MDSYQGKVVKLIKSQIWQFTVTSFLVFIFRMKKNAVLIGVKLLRCSYEKQTKCFIENQGINIGIVIQTQPSAQDKI